MVSYGQVSMEEFKRLLDGEGTSTQKLQHNIEESNIPVEDQLPELFKYKIKTASQLLNPGEAQRELKDLMKKQESTDRFLSVVSNVRDERVEITSVVRGHRADGRDYILKGRDPETGVNVMDLRVLLGDPVKNGADIRNEVTSTAFYKKVGLSAYREKASLN